MDDLISRWVAIEAILEDKIDSKSLEIMRVLGNGMQAQTFNDTCDRHAQIIKTLPSAEPEIIRCKDCKCYQFSDGKVFGMPVKMCTFFSFEDMDEDDWCSRAERKERGD